MRFNLPSLLSAILMLTLSSSLFAQNTHIINMPGTIHLPGGNGPSIPIANPNKTIYPKYHEDDRAILPSPNPRNPPKEYIIPSEINAPVVDNGPLPETTGICSREKEGYTKVDRLNLFYCDGTSWQVILLSPTARTCTQAQLGKYLLTEEKRLEFCNGVNWLATGDKVVENCTSNQLGKMRFTAVTSGAVSTKVVQFCNGENWLDTTKHEIGSTTPTTPGEICNTTPEFNPVCDAQNKIYKNASHAACLNATVVALASPGEIRKGICGMNQCNRGQPSPTVGVIYVYCGSNGREYFTTNCEPFDVPMGVSVVWGMCPR